MNQACSISTSVICAAWIRKPSPTRSRSCPTSAAIGASCSPSPSCPSAWSLRRWVDCRARGMADDLQFLLDKAARLKKRIEFRKQTNKTLEKRYETLREEIAQRVPKEADPSTASQTKGGGTSWT